MRVSFAICVCNEHNELKNLLSFLKKVKRDGIDEIVVLVDSSKENKLVSAVLYSFSNDVRIFHRAFDGDFANHKNFLNDQCSGEIIFNIDADEIPQESLVKIVQELRDDDGKFDVVYVPRINICPGYTEEFIKKHGFKVNEMGWINWPDYQGRIYKKHVKWVGKVHEHPDGKSVSSLPAEPACALWHIKSVERQNRQNQLYSELEQTIKSNSSLKRS